MAMRIIDRPLVEQQIHLHIGGEPRATGSGGTHEHLNCFSQKPQAQVPLAGAAEIDEAVALAVAAQEGGAAPPLSCVATSCSVWPT
ncbi:hypothetical protein ACFS32_04795 [Novosphingobium pokkalii]|uniref:hypothetical protein n=1 Tax=Novosphingobium pokkalii TaxID=1770194 RepID=UPI00362CC6AD